jgi:hypothetical protein
LARYELGVCQIQAHSEQAGVATSSTSLHELKYSIEVADSFAYATNFMACYVLM